MDASKTHTDSFNIRIAKDLRCPHCRAVLSPSAVERRDRGGWRMICQSSHRDIVTTEPAE
jgi:hypothetical protein